MGAGGGRWSFAFQKSLGFLLGGILQLKVFGAFKNTTQ